MFKIQLCLYNPQSCTTCPKNIICHSLHTSVVILKALEERKWDSLLLMRCTSYSRSGGVLEEHAHVSPTSSM